jgi:acyl-CoA reductase-like NAD-dependent aldehyde dehydrogenase
VPQPDTLQINARAIHPVCPADGNGLQPNPIIPATEADTDAAIAKASNAQRTWAKSTFRQRRRLLKTLLHYILSNQDDIVKACCLDSGKTKIDANFGEILATAEKLQWTINHGENALRPSKRPTNLLMSYKSNTVLYEPLGVVAACVSWNYPFHNFISPVISALFSGNAIVVKPSEQTAWSSVYFTKIIQNALVACGHSPDLLQNIICFPDVADHLTSHPDIKHITFIGSRQVAHKVALSASRSLTALTVELGGKDPAIVLDDPSTIADIDNIACILMRGTFQASGQNCIGLERVIALPRAHDHLLSTIKPLIKFLRLGAVLRDSKAPDIGSMISSRSFPHLEELISIAVTQGAILHCGGKRFEHPVYPKGHYFQPTLLSNVTSEMAIAQTELFAPIFLLMAADTVEDAIAIANSTPYALGAAVFGHHKPDVQKCVRSIRAGNVAVNDFAAFYVCSMPFGGRDGSGYGRFGGEEGLRGLCNIKSVCEDASWARVLGMKTSIPPPLRYPVDGLRGWAVCKGVVETGYAVTLAGRARGLYGLLRALTGRGFKTKAD